VCIVGDLCLRKSGIMVYAAAMAAQEKCVVIWQIEVKRCMYNSMEFHAIHITHCHLLVCGVTCLACRQELLFCACISLRVF
jgi:hypothetical protein